MGLGRPTIPRACRLGGGEFKQVVPTCLREDGEAALNANEGGGGCGAEDPSDPPPRVWTREGREGGGGGRGGRGDRRGGGWPPVRVCACEGGLWICGGGDGGWWWVPGWRLGAKEVVVGGGGSLAREGGGGRGSGSRLGAREGLGWRLGVRDVVEGVVVDPG